MRKAAKGCEGAGKELETINKELPKLRASLAESRKVVSTTRQSLAQALTRQEQVEPEGTFNEIITGPVSNWATDFSHLEPEWAADPYPIQDDLRDRCPFGHRPGAGRRGLRQRRSVFRGRQPHGAYRPGRRTCVAACC